MKACEDFLYIVLHALVKAAYAEVMVDCPSGLQLDVATIAEKIVEKFVNIDKEINHDDDIFLYSTELLTLCLIWLNYYDSIKEGDGDRVMLIWKFLLIIFKKTNRKNYSLEAFTQLINYHFLLPERLAEQMKWSRFINTKGRSGCNLPCDLHLEHLNRQLKGILRNLRSNLDSNTIHRAGRSLGLVHTMLTQFSKDLSVPNNSSIHHRPAFKKDLEKLFTILQEAQSFVQHDTQRSFVSKFKVKSSLLGNIRENEEKMIDWMVEKTSTMIF